MEIRLFEDNGPQSELHTLVKHRADIVVIAAEARGDCKRVVQKHIPGLSVVIFHDCRKTALQECRIHAYIEIAVLFPGDQAVLYGARHCSRSGTVGPAVIETSLPGIVRTKVIISLNSVRGPNGQVAEPR